MSTQEQLGADTLTVLDDEYMLIVLGALSRGPVRAGDILEGTSGVTRRPVRLRLRRLAERGWVRMVAADDTPLDIDVRALGRHDRLPRDARFGLTDTGGVLLQVAWAAARFESSWRPPPARHRPAGACTIHLVADPATRAIIRALADGPLGVGALVARLPWLGLETLHRRLALLSSEAVIAHERDTYTLAQESRHMAIVAVRAAHCEWLSDPAARTTRLNDLPGLLHTIDSLARLEPEVSGTCRWRFDYSGIVEPDVFLSAGGGRVAALATPPLRPERAASHARPEIWCQALLAADHSVLDTTGDQQLNQSVLRAISRALLE